MNSPYSRYGIGDIEPQGCEINRSMGGVGISLRMPNQINYLNPASYTSQDTMSFIWDIGLRGNFTTYQTNLSKHNQKNFNFDHLALSFPITRWLFASAGMMPYSKVGYDYAEKFDFSDGNRIKVEYYGSGYLNKFYIGNGLKLFDGLIHIGYNASYLFGSIYHNTSIYTVNSEDNAYGMNIYKKYDVALTGWLFSIGTQSEIKIDNKNKIIIGATYDIKSNLNAELSNYFNWADTILANNPDTGKYIIPAKLGFGISYLFNNQLTVGIDFNKQDWSKAKFLGQNDSLQNMWRISTGIEFVKDKNSYLNYWSRVRYRIGFRYENTYLSLYNNPIKDMALSFGVGLPFKRTNTIFNVGFEIGKRGTTSNNLVQDNYKRFFISVSLYDYWFIKRKYN